MFLKINYKYRNKSVTCPIELGRGVTSPNVWSQLTQISENSAIHQHVVHYSSVSGLKRRQHLQEHINGHYLGQSKLPSAINLYILKFLFICSYQPSLFLNQSSSFQKRKQIYCSSTWQYTLVHPVNFVSCDQTFEVVTHLFTFSHFTFHFLYIFKILTNLFQSETDNQPSIHFRQLTCGPCVNLFPVCVQHCIINFKPYY